MWWHQAVADMETQTLGCHLQEFQAKTLTFVQESHLELEASPEAQTNQLQSESNCQENCHWSNSGLSHYEPVTSISSHLDNGTTINSSWQLDDKIAKNSSTDPDNLNSWSPSDESKSWILLDREPSEADTFYRETDRFNSSYDRRMFVKQEEMDNQDSCHLTDDDRRNSSYVQMEPLPASMVNIQNDIEGRGSSSYGQDGSSTGSIRSNHPLPNYGQLDIASSQMNGYFPMNNGYFTGQYPSMLSTVQRIPMQELQGRALSSRSGMGHRFMYRMPYSPIPSPNRECATERERTRMHMLNDAFDELRKVVPKSNLSEHQRLSKIATLRLAIHYIAALTSILKSTGGEIQLVKDVAPVAKGKRKAAGKSEGAAKKAPKRPRAKNTKQKFSGNEMDIDGGDLHSPKKD